MAPLLVSPPPLSPVPPVLLTPQSNLQDDLFAPHGGFGWGGTCRCPDDTLMLASDSGGNDIKGCTQLECIGGVKESCQKAVGAWSRKRAICRPSPAIGTVFVVGWQKTGSTIMSLALAMATARKMNTEAAHRCCSPGTPAALGNFTCIADERSLGAPLWLADYSRYIAACRTTHEDLGARKVKFRESALAVVEALEAKRLASGEAIPAVLKADDFLWQVDSLMEYCSGVVPQPSPTTPGVAFVFVVRHMLYNVRSLLAWCEGKATRHNMTCNQFVQSSRQRGEGNLLFGRIFTTTPGDAIASSPISLAGIWKQNAQVYLRDPSRFATMLRYEDFSADPVASIARVQQHALGHIIGFDPGHTSPYRMIFEEQLLGAIQVSVAYTATYNHSDPSSLFPPTELDAMVILCRSEMSAFGYSKTGTLPLPEDL
jgi:hypothetical protein